MKKFLLILLALFVLVIGAAVAIPFLFKDKLIAYAKDAANENLEATVDFGDFDLTLFKSFPNLTFTIEQVTVDGKNEFEGVRLAQIGELTFTLDIMGLFAGNMELKKFGVSNADIDVRVLADGAANYNIMKESDEVVEETPAEESSEFQFKLKAYYFNNINIKYSDATLAFDMLIEKLNHTGSGDFTQDNFILSTKSDIAAMDVVFDGVKYLKRAKLDAEMDIEIDMLASKYTFSKNEIELNELYLGIDGWVAMPEDPIDMDLKFYATKTEFRNILSLVPAEFASDLAGVDVTGTLALNGFAKGIYFEEVYPAFGLDLKVENGRLKYSDLPASADNIAIDCKINSPGGDLDKMVIDLSRFHVEMAGNPLDAHLMMKTPMSDPDINAGLKAAIDLANISKVVPMEEELTGELDADITMKGRYSSIENERYDEFEAGGFLNLKNFHYKDPEAYNMDINEAALSFNPQFAELSKLEMSMEGIDIRAQGRLENYIAYGLKDSTLVGFLNMQSSKIDINKFMDAEEETASSDSAVVEESAPIEVPANINFALNAEIEELIYDNVSMKNVKGAINVANQIVSLKNLNMDVLQGKVILNGAFNAVNPTKPLVDFSYDAQNLDINETASSFNTVEKLAPLAKKATGKFSTKMTFSSALDQNLEPIMESIAGKGNLQSKNIYIEGFEPLNELARTLKIDRLSKQNIEDVKFDFEIRDGRVHIEPFDVKIDKMNSNIAGSTGLDQTIDYVMKLKIPTEMLQGPAMGVVQGLLGQANAALGSNMTIGDKVDVGVLVTGTVEKPIFKPSFGSVVNTQSVKEVVKEAVKEKIEEVKTEVIDKSVDEAKAQAAKLIAEAQKQSDNLKAEAKKQADNIRDEGKRAAKRLEDEAKNPIAKAAAKEAGKKLISEADKNAQKVESEAAKKGDGIVNEAKKQGDKLISDAENKLR